MQYSLHFRRRLKPVPETASEQGARGRWPGRIARGTLPPLPASEASERSATHALSPRAQAEVAALLSAFLRDD